jgi:hypothetical protein
MTEQKYNFGTLGIHDVIVVQSAIETRKVEMTKDLKGSDRAIKAVIEELDLMYSNLDAHIAQIEREQFYHDKAKKEKEMIWMSLETRGVIKFDPDVKSGEAEYTIECKPLGICEGGSGDLLEDIETLTEKVRTVISEEFNIPPCDVVLTRYSMSLVFDVSAPVHKTLDQFTKKEEAENLK